MLLITALSIDKTPLRHFSPAYADGRLNRYNLRYSPLCLGVVVRESACGLAMSQYKSDKSGSPINYHCTHANTPHNKYHQDLIILCARKMLPFPPPSRVTCTSTLLLLSSRASPLILVVARVPRTCTRLWRKPSHCFPGR